MFPYLEVTTREGIGMEGIATAVALLGSLGVACAKAEAETPMPQAAAQAPVVGLSDGVVKAAMTDAGLTNFTGVTTVGLSNGLTKAAMVEAGLTNFTGGVSK